MKRIEDFKVTHVAHLNARNTLLVLTPRCPDEPLTEFLEPGQFVQVRIDGVRDTFLRRPISLHFVTNTEVWLLVQHVGKGTEKLGSLEVGDCVNMVLPLGNGWDAALRDRKRFLLVGGGVGIAPLLYLGARLKAKGGEVHFLLGFRSREEEMQLEEYRKYGEVHLSTDDGSDGTPGFVTQNPVLLEGGFDQVYVCGPTPMMKAVAHVCAKQQMPCQVSLENKMACGIGACLCCVTPDRNDHHLCVCTDGPVFNSETLGW